MVRKHKIVGVQNGPEAHRMVLERKMGRECKMIQECKMVWEYALAVLDGAFSGSTGSGLGFGVQNGAFSRSIKWSALQEHKMVWERKRVQEQKACLDSRFTA